MNNIIKKMVCIIILFTIILIGGIKDVLATSEAEELMNILDQYKDQLGNLDEFKQVIDETYNDIQSATEVNDDLKEKLKEDIKKLENVTNINPLILNALEVELTTQIENLNNENLGEFKYEIEVIKGWIDEQYAGNLDTDNENETPNAPTTPTTPPSAQQNNTTISGNQNIANMILPKAGKLAPVFLVVIGIILANVIYSIIKYKRYKGI